MHACKKSRQFFYHLSRPLQHGRPGPRRRPGRGPGGGPGSPGRGGRQRGRQQAVDGGLSRGRAAGRAAVVFKVVVHYALEIESAAAAVHAPHAAAAAEPSVGRRLLGQVRSSSSSPRPVAVEAGISGRSGGVVAGGRGGGGLPRLEGVCGGAGHYITICTWLGG